MPNEYEKATDTRREHDAVLQEESRTWSDIARSCYSRKGCDADGRKQRDDTISMLAKDLVKFDTEHTMSKESGWDKVWHTALADPNDNLKVQMAFDLAEEYNQQAERLGSPKRVDAFLENDHGTILNISHFDKNAEKYIDNDRERRRGAYVIKQAVKNYTIQF